MGFLDNFLKKLGAKFATRYGVVSSGEYEGCSVAMGNPPKTKVNAACLFSQIIFIKDDEEAARFNIGKDIIDFEYVETIKFPKTGADGFRCKLTFEKGDTCDIDVFPSTTYYIDNSLKGIMRKETCEFFENEMKKIYDSAGRN